MGSKKKKFFKYSILASIVLFFFIPIISLFILLFVPSYVEQELLPSLAKQFQIQDFHGNVRRLNFSAVDVGPITLGTPEKALLKVENVHASYSLLGLLRKEIEKLTISGVHLIIDSDSNGKMTLRGIDLHAITSQFQKESQKKSDNSVNVSQSSSENPFLLRNLYLNNVMIDFWYNQKLYFLQMSLSAKFANINQKIPEIKGALRFREKEIRFTLINENNNLWVFRWNADSSISQFTEFVQLPIDRLSGDIQMDGTIQISQNQKHLQIESILIEGVIKHLNAMYRSENQSILWIRSNQNPTVPFKFKYEKSADFTEKMVNGEMKKEFSSACDFSLSNLHCSLPVNAQLNFAGSAQNKDSLWSLNWSIFANLKQQSRLLPKLDFGQNFPIQCNGLITQQKDQKISGDYHISLPEKTPVLYDQTQVAMGKNSQLSGSFSWTSEQGFQLQNKTSIKSVFANHPKFKINVDELAIEGGIKNQMRFGGDLKFNGVNFQYPNLILTFPQITVTANDNHNGQIQSLLAGSNGTVSYSNGLIKSQNISFQLPCSYPLKGKQEPGFFKISELKIKDKPAIDLELTLQQEDSTLFLSGLFQSPMLDGLAGQIGVKANWIPEQSLVDVSGKVTIPECNLPSKYDLGSWTSSLQGFTIDGQFSLDLDFSFGQRNYWNFSTQFRNGNLTNVAQAMDLSGIHLQLNVEPGVNGWRTPSGQILTVEKVQFGPYHTDHLQLKFRVDEKQRFYPESLSFDWAGGKVNSLTSELNSEMTNFQLVLYCDQLKLKDILFQTAGEVLVKFEDDVLVSGLIPLELKNHNLILGNGYLYTMPGKKGLFRLVVSDGILQNIPQDSPAFGQLELARSALTNFNYDWITLQLGMGERENHITQHQIKLKVFGKPVKPLPFAFDAKKGTFVKKVMIEGTGIMQDMEVGLNLNSDADALSLAITTKQFLSQISDELKMLLGQFITPQNKK